MNTLLEKLERIRPYANILVACRSGGEDNSLSDIIQDSEANLIGPVDRASMALLLAAQTPIDLAIIETELAGVRSGFVLAERLQQDWGVPSLIMGGQAALSEED